MYFFYMHAIPEATLWGVPSVVIFCRAFFTCSTCHGRTLQVLCNTIGNWNFQKKTQQNIAPHCTSEMVGGYELNLQLCMR